MWKISDRVFAQKGNDHFWYPGTVRHIDGERCYVIFDDGDDALVDDAQLKALDLHAGDGVFARMPTEAEFKPAKVLAWDDEKVQVQWLSGEQNWTSFGMIRLQPETAVPTEATGQQHSAGDRVFACWHDLFWYPAVVLAVNGDQYQVLFDHGNQAVVTSDRIRPLALDNGDRVFCRRQDGSEFLPGEITRRQGEVIHVRYDDGEEENTSLRLVRLERDDWFPPSDPGKIHKGDRLLGCWFDLHWYPGVVLSIDGKRLHFLFDDGDQALMTPDKMRPLDIKVGDRVWARFKGGQAYFPGEVTTKQGEVIHINYDDGDEETTSIRLIRIQTDSSADMGEQHV
jgi:DNA repair protein Crb2 Tudor domain